MSRYCPIIQSSVTYLFCHDCDEKYLCRNNEYKKNNDHLTIKPPKNKEKKPCSKE